MQSIHGLPIATSLEEACDPRRLALLIYDMQVGICQQVSCGPAITEACKRLRDRCRAAGVPVACSRHLSLPTHWMGPFQTRMAMAWQRVDDPDAVKPWFLRGAQGFQLVPDLAPTEDEFLFDKLAMSAFEGLLCSSLCAIAASQPLRSAVSHWRSALSRQCAMPLISALYPLLSPTPAVRVTRKRENAASISFASLVTR